MRTTTKERVDREVEYRLDEALGIFRQGKAKNGMPLAGYDSIRILRGIRSALAEMKMHDALEVAQVIERSIRAELLDAHGQKDGAR